MTSKSYWQEAYTGSDNAKDAVKSWFGYLADGMTVEKAELLLDSETDREKKIRAFMTNAQGQRYQFERTLGGRKYKVSMKPVPCVAPSPQDSEAGK
jgi:hypothetical protein